MIFERLRLSGFKSFADPTELPILPGLTGVVGPNGCGKSNLTEGLRWAMGEGSTRGLRAEAMDDVIFAGSRGRPGRGFADAVLGLTVDGKQTEISRRIDKGEGSTYRMNGKEVRLRDVQLLFADAATGAHAAALVGQGRISAIISAKPVERRLMLEEAAGVAGLSVRRREAEIRLRAAAANLERVDDLVREIAAQVEALKRQAKAAERYAAISARIRLGEARLLHAQWVAAFALAGAAGAAARAAEETAAGRRAELERLEAARTAEAATAAAIADELRELERVREQLAGSAARLADEEARVTGRRRELEEAGRLVERDRAREAAMAAEAQAARDRLRREATEIAAGSATRAATHRDAETARDAAAAAVPAAEAELSAALEARATARAEAVAAAAALKAAADQVARIAAEQARLMRERDALTPLEAGAEARALATIEAAEQAANAARATLESARGEQAAAEAARTAARADAQAVRTARATLRAEADALAPSVRAAAGALASVTAAPGYEAALAAALGADLGAAVGEAGKGWARVVAADDPALPAGAEPLGNHVTAPPELARRLAQVGVAADAETATTLAPALAPGQRLVTRDGALWRWDGFEALKPADLGAAQRLRAQNRLKAIQAEEATLAAREGEAAAALAGADTRAADAQRALRTAEAALDAALKERRTAEAAAEGARAARARAEARSAALEAALERLADDHAAALRTRESAEVRLAEAPDAAAADRTADAAQAAAVAARARAEAAAATARAARAAEEDAARRTAAIAREEDALAVRIADAAARLAELDARADTLAAELAALADAPARIAAERAKLEAARADLAQRTQALATRRSEAERASAATEAARAEAAEALAAAREARAAAQVEADHARNLAGTLGAQALERFSAAVERLPERLGFDAAADPAPVSAELEADRAARERLGAVNLRAADELKETSERLQTLETERGEVETAINRLRGQIGALNRDGRERLLATFQTVDFRFRELFTRLFNGGEAHLKLIDDEDPLLAGLEIFAKPPGKATRTLGLLSGGEQALTAIALIFAFFLANPAPICVLDEVDAPLDDANTERFCDLIRSVAGEAPTRFLIVTHNPLTMARMDRLFGVTMAEPGVSQLVSVDLAQAEVLALAAE